MANRVRPAVIKLATRLVLATVFLVTAGLTACSTADVPAAPSDDDELVLGEDVYARNCVSCHGSDGDGGVGTRLNQGQVVAAFPEPGEQLEVVADGRKAMPSFDGKLSEAELAAVVRYTREVIADQT